MLIGAPTDIGTVKQGTKISFGAPGDDLLCGTADHYEMATSSAPISESDFSTAKQLTGAPDPTAPGTVQKLAVPKGSEGYVAIRAVDDQGNVGRVASVKAKASGGGNGCLNRIGGSDQADHLRGTSAGDDIRGKARNDRIDGRGGADCIRGGNGADRLTGGDGKDEVSGGKNGDHIVVNDGAKDAVECGKGRDKVVADRKDSPALARLARHCPDGVGAKSKPTQTIRPSAVVPATATLDVGRTLALRVTGTYGDGRTADLREAVRAHYSRGAVDTETLRQWWLPVLIGVIAGSVTARYAPERLFKIVFVAVAWSAAARLLLARATWKFGDTAVKAVEASGGGIVKGAHILRFWSRASDTETVLQRSLSPDAAATAGARGPARTRSRP